MDKKNWIFSIEIEQKKSKTLKLEKFVDYKPTETEQKLICVLFGDLRFSSKISTNTDDNNQQIKETLSNCKKRWRNYWMY